MYLHTLWLVNVTVTQRNLLKLQKFTLITYIARIMCPLFYTTNTLSISHQLGVKPSISLWIPAFLFSLSSPNSVIIYTVNIRFQVFALQQKLTPLIPSFFLLLQRTVRKTSRSAGRALKASRCKDGWGWLGRSDRAGKSTQLLNFVAFL